MRRLQSRLASLFRNLFRGTQVERDLDDELNAAVETLADRYAADGMPRDQARRAACLELGGVEQLKEEIRDGRVGATVDAASIDARYALRTLAKSPGFTAAVVITMALGIGANSAIFSVVHALLLAPLPYRDADRLIFVWSDMTDSGYPRAPLSGPELGDLRCIHACSIDAPGPVLKYSCGAVRRRRKVRPAQGVGSVAPVEVAGAAPEGVVVRGRLLLGLGREADELLGGEGLLAVHRLLDSRLLLGLEERVVLEWIRRLVLVEWHVLLELRVAALQLEMFLDYVRKDGRRLYRHETSLVGRSLLTGRRGMIAGSVERSEASRWGGRVGSRRCRA